MTACVRDFSSIWREELLRLNQDSHTRVEPCLRRMKHQRGRGSLKHRDQRPRLCTRVVKRRVSSVSELSGRSRLAGYLDQQQQLFAQLRYLGANMRAHTHALVMKRGRARAGLTRLAAHSASSFVIPAFLPSEAHTLTPSANKAHAQPARS